MWIMISSGMFGPFGKLIQFFLPKLEVYDRDAHARLQKILDNRANAERAVDAVCQVYGLPMRSLNDKKFQQAVKAVALSQGWEIVE